eukprot:TRINITY_DN2062_c0_g2_i1.p1 TRINITY_DN2062_c0_g2~~TRINITY_DN2062_c0_g2_i1.p1  ORF type:complete len:710 (-),score=173.40 TRINITY_DN2062_c0_g2_i1:55-2184(-)
MSIRRSEIAVKSAALNHVAMGATCSAVGFIAAGYLEEEDDRTKGWLQLRSPDDYKNAALSTFSPSLPAVYNIFVFSISKNHEFASLVRDVSQGRYAGGDDMTVSERIMPLCFACYSETEKLLRSDSGESMALRAAEAEIEHLRLQINSCNLSALKQIEAMRAGGDTELADERHQFYEPLQYMNPETKELVLLCMFQKLRQLDMDTAAEPLTKSLVEMIHSMGGKGEVRRGRSEEETGEGDDYIKADGGNAHVSRKKAAQAGMEASKKFKEFEAKLEASKKFTELEAKLEETERKIREMSDMAMQTEESLRQANANLRDMAMQCEAATSEARASQAQLATADGQLRQLESELQHAREEAGKTALHESQAKEARERLEQLEIEKLNREAHVKALEAEVRKLRGKGDKQVSGMQTDLTGDEIDGFINENTKLKVMLEEMKAKLADLAEDMKSKGVDVSKALEKAGLQRFLGTKPIFERLYQDAVDRIDRMERLREKYAKEQQLTTMDQKRHGHGPVSPTRTLPCCRVCGRRMSDLPEMFEEEEEALPLSIVNLEASVRSPQHGKRIAELLTDGQGERLPPPQEIRQSQGCHILWADELFEESKMKGESPLRQCGGPTPSSDQSGVEDVAAQSRRWLPCAAEDNLEGPVGTTRTGLLIVGGGSPRPARRRAALGKSVSLPALHSNPQAAQAMSAALRAGGGRRRGTDVTGALC